MSRAVRPKLTGVCFESGNFDPEFVGRVIPILASESIPDALRDAVKAERRLSTEGPGPLERFLRENEFLKGEDDIAGSVKTAVPKEYMHDWSAALETPAPLYSFFDLLREEHPAVFELVKAAYSASRTFEKEGLDELGKMVQSHIDRDDVVIPHRKASSLYFLTLLPDPMRHSIQGLLVRKCNIDYFREQMSHCQQEDREFISDVISWQQSQIWLDHWPRLVREYTASEGVVARLIEASMESITAMTSIKNAVVGRESPKRILEGFRAHMADRMRQMKEVSDLFENDRLQYSDIYHCFEWMDDLEWCLRDPDILKVGRPKNGRYAAILEDDISQRQRFAEMIDEASQFNMLPEGIGLCDSPADILSIETGLPVGFYLLDIDNRGDRTAGIETAKALILKVIEEQTLPRTEDCEQVIIILWSSSPVLVKEANEALIRFREEKGLGRMVSGIDVSFMDAPVEVMVKSKAESPF